MTPKKPMPKFKSRDTAFTDRVTMGPGIPRSDPLKSDAAPKVKQAVTSEALPKIEPATPSDPKPKVEPAIKRDPTPKAERTTSTEPTPATKGKAELLNINVSLSEATAQRAERFASYGQISVGTLIRALSKKFHEKVINGWVENGLPDTPHDIARSKHNTTVRIKVPSDFAARTLKERDPLGLIGLPRTLAPFYRDAFEEEFDEEAKKHGF